MSTLSPLLLGFAFGFLLQKGGLTRYERIVGVFRFTDLTVLKFMLSAIVVGSAATYGLAAWGLGVAIPVKQTAVAANLTGGLLHGAGMALAGLCPGTIVAGAGEGSLDYLVPGTLGLLAGALLLGFTYPTLVAPLWRPLAPGPVTLMSLAHVDTALVVLLLAEVSALLFYVIDRGIARRA